MEQNLGGGTGAKARGAWATSDASPSANMAAAGATNESRAQHLAGNEKHFSSSDASSLVHKPAEVEALVLIKIMRHCREYFPTPVNGLLLGMDNAARGLVVSDSFSLLNKSDLWNQLAKEKLDSREVDEKVANEENRYQMKMLEQLSLVNTDCCNVGWYQSLQMEDIKNQSQSIIEALCEHQELVAEAIGIGYDPNLASLGTQAFKAYRVSPGVLKAHKEAQLSDAAAFNVLRSKDVLVEVPLVVRNSLLVQAFLTDWLKEDTSLQAVGDFESLEEDDRAPFVQKSLEFISNCLDDLYMEQEKLKTFQKDSVRANQKSQETAQRRKLENDQRLLHGEELLPDLPVTSARRGEYPNQLPTLVMASHINSLSSTIGQVVSDNLTRSVLLQKMVGSDK